MAATDLAQLFHKVEITGKQRLLEIRRTFAGAWMDHHWFTEQLDPAQRGWDWFSVQLDERTELMLFELRRKDGSNDPYSAGTFVDADGKAHHLRHEDFSLLPMRR